MVLWCYWQLGGTVYLVCLYFSLWCYFCLTTMFPLCSSLHCLIRWLDFVSSFLSFRYDSSVLASKCGLILLSVEELHYLVFFDSFSILCSFFLRVDLRSHARLHFLAWGCKSSHSVLDFFAWLHTSSHETLHHSGVFWTYSCEKALLHMVCGTSSCENLVFFGLVWKIGTI